MEVCWSTSGLSKLIVPYISTEVIAPQIIPIQTKSRARPYNGANVKSWLDSRHDDLLSPILAMPRVLRPLVRLLRKLQPVHLDRFEQDEAEVT